MKRQSQPLDAPEPNSTWDEAQKRARLDVATSETPGIQEPAPGLLSIRNVAQINRLQNIVTESRNGDLSGARLIPAEGEVLDNTNDDAVEVELDPYVPTEEHVDGINATTDGAETNGLSEEHEDVPITNATEGDHGSDLQAGEQANDLNATADANVVIKQENKIKIEIKTEIKDEPIDSTDQPSTSSGSNQTTNTKIEVKSEAIQTTPVTLSLRPSCNFGIRCYLRRPAHRNDMAHPGDPDYRRPDCPPANPGAPPCPFGARCYRRNPEHFMQLRHPPSDEYNPDASGVQMPILIPNPPIILPSTGRRNVPSPVYVTSYQDDEEYESDVDYSSGDTSDLFEPTSEDEDWLL